MTGCPGIFNRKTFNCFVAGEYCPDFLLSATAGVCDAGYYCIGYAEYQNPIAIVEKTIDSTLTDTGGEICPAGTYCEAGDTDPQDCPIGKEIQSL